jgi:hypothetical protein
VSQRHYVVVGIDVERPFADEDASSDREKEHVARLVGALLRRAIFVDDLDAEVVGAIALSSDDVDRITEALRRSVEQSDAQWRVNNAEAQAAIAALRRIGPCLSG